MEEQVKEQTSATEAAMKLLERDENGKYMIGTFNAQEERENLTQVVEILSQIDLSKEDPDGYKKLRNSLGMIGAYDRYGYMDQQSTIKSFSEFSDKCNLGDMTPARMYVNRFFGQMDAFSRSQIDDKFSQGMQAWIEASKGMLEKPTISIEKYAKYSLEKERFGRNDLGDGIEVVKPEGQRGEE